MRWNILLSHYSKNGRENQLWQGKTQKEVREKMQAAAVAINDGTYTDPSRLTVGQWLDIWQRDYLGNVKIGTISVYRSYIKKHIRPGLGAIRLRDLHPHTIQGFINGITGISPSSVRLAYKVLRMALEKAVDLDYLPRNPANKCILPKLEQKEPRPLNDEQTAALLDAAKGTPMEQFITVALFTGLRLSEMLGLTWDVIDFDNGTISINKQLTNYELRSAGLFQSPKSGKSRILHPASAVFVALKRHRRRQAEMQLRAGPAWSNPNGLVFTIEDGSPIDQWKAERNFRNIATAAGLSEFRFHALRHTYAVNAIRAGDDIKTIQASLGHSTAAFTLDKYGHVTERMKQDSATRMEHFIRDVMKL